MIELTREEALAILKLLSQVDGFLLGVKESNHVTELLDYPSDLLIEKLK